MIIIEKIYLFLMLFFVFISFKVDIFLYIYSIFSILYLTFRTFYIMHPPFSNIYETFLFISFLFGIKLLISEREIRKNFILKLPIVIFLIIAIFIPEEKKQFVRLPEILKSHWFYIHIPAFFIGYLSIIFAFLISFLWNHPFKDKPLKFKNQPLKNEIKNTQNENIEKSEKNEDIKLSEKKGIKQFFSQNIQNINQNYNENYKRNLRIQNLLDIKTDNLLDKKILLLINKELRLATVFMIIGIWAGAMWGYVSWGSYWNWDPKEISSLITIIIIMLAYFENNNIFIKKTLILSGFIMLLWTYFGVTFILKSLHSY